MSLIKSIANLGRSILSNPIATKVAAAIPGIGTGVALAGTAYQAYQALKPAGGAQINALPSIGGMSTMSAQAGMMGLSPAVIRGAGTAVVAGAKSVARGAVSLCRKYPQWCSTIGGSVAVEALMHSGQLPVPKRRRGKGITAHELKAFKRVARFTSKYCAPVHKAMKSPAVRHRRSACQ